MEVVVRCEGGAVERRPVGCLTDSGPDPYADTSHGGEGRIVAYKSKKGKAAWEEGGPAGANWSLSIPRSFVRSLFAHSGT